MTIIKVSVIAILMSLAFAAVSYSQNVTHGVIHSSVIDPDVIDPDVFHN